MKAKGHAAIVTGAGLGLGEATARALAEAGAKVAVFDVDEDGAEPPSNWWTPLLSSVRSKEVFDDESASEFHG